MNVLAQEVTKEDELIGYIKHSMGISPVYYLIAVAIFLLLFITWKKISVSLLITYCFLIFATTVLARTSRDNVSYDMTPFRLFQIDEWWTKQDLMLQIKANVLMFVPIGFLFMLAGKGIKGKFVKVLYIIVSIIVGFLFSLLIEYMQYKLNRGLCEVDDVIHNTIGIAIGIVLYWIISRIYSELDNRDILPHRNNQ